MNVPVRAGPAPTVAVVPVPESEMDALLLGRTAVRNFDQYVRNVCITLSLHVGLGRGVGASGSNPLASTRRDNESIELFLELKLKSDPSRAFDVFCVLAVRFDVYRI
ncbi:unnamed protein product, partial [Iphiclides podalirius]